MRIALFGGVGKGSPSLTKLLELREKVVGVFYFTQDSHEEIWYDKVQDTAKINSIPIFEHHEPNITNILTELKPNLILAVGWRYKIPKEQYTIPSKGCVIIHDSLLPAYRGFAPMNWAIINGEKSTGATMFYASDEIDAGDIIAQKKVSIGITDNAKTMDRKITSLYLELISENIPLIDLGKAPRITQDQSQATYTCKRIPSDGLIDWTKTSNEIHNLIRGLTKPYPGAFIYLTSNVNPKKMYIWTSSLDNKKYVSHIPGRVMEIIKDHGIRVSTGDGSIIIEKVQFDRKEVVTADKLIHSIKTTLGRV